MRMPRSRGRLTLGGRIENRRKDLGLTQTQAARQTGVHRNTWRAWAQGARPDDSNHRAIEEFCDWAAGSVEAALEGRLPTRRQVASVTELHPGDAHAPSDRELVALVAEWRDMELPAGFIDGLIEAYRSEKAAADTQRRERYRDIARRKAVGE